MKKLSVILIALVLALGIAPVFSAAAEGETLATYTQDFTDIDSVRQDFSAYSVYDLGTGSEIDTIAEDIDGKGYWYINSENGEPQITRKNLEDGKPLENSYGTKYIRVLTFTRQKFVNFEMEVDFKRGSTTLYWAGVAIRQLNQGKYFLEDGAGIFNQQEGQTTLWGTDGVGGPHESDPIQGFDANGYHHLKVVCNGLSLQVFVDGNLTMSRTLPRTFFRKGYVSLVSVNNDCSYKNFKIKELPIERLPEEEAQSPIPESDSENSLTNLSKLPPVDRVKVTLDGNNTNSDVWTVTAIVTGCTALLSAAGVVVVLILNKKKSNKTNGDNSQMDE